MDETDKPEVVVAHTAVRVRTTEYSEGGRTEARTVRCPISNDSKTLEHCAGCPRLAAMTHQSDGSTVLSCVVPWAVARPRCQEPDDLAELMATTPVADVMATAVMCVDSELGLDAVAQMLDHCQLAAAPVVEDAGVLIGVVSRSDLLRGHSDEQDQGDGHLPPPPSPGGLDQIVDDVMTTSVVKLSESASLAEAMKLFSLHGLNQVPITAADDTVVGVLSVMDLVRWLAKRS